MDDVDDLFSEPAVAAARPAGRFRPKAKLRPSKVASTAAASTLPDIITEKPVTSSTIVSDAVPSIESVDEGDGKLADPAGSSLATSEIIGSTEPSKNNENLSPGAPLSDGNKDAKPCESAAAAVLQPEVPASDENGDLNSSFGKTAGENADIFSGLECLDDFQTIRGTAESAANKSHDKADMGTEPGDKLFPSCSDNHDEEGSVPHSELATGSAVNYIAPTHCSAESSAFMACDVAEAQTYSDYCKAQDPVSCREVCGFNTQCELQLETMVDGAFSDFEVLDVVSDATFSSERPAGKFQPKLKVKKGKENLDTPRSEVESTKLSQAVDSVPSETGAINESSLPAFSAGHVLDHPSPRIGDSSTPNPTSDSQVNTENLAETAHSDGAILGDTAHSEDVAGLPGRVAQKSRKRKSVAACEEAEGGTSSRQLRKRLPRQKVDELVHEANEDILKPSSDSNVNEDDNNDDEYREHKTSQRKRAPRKSKKPASEKEPVRKRKTANTAPDQSTKDPPKKFTHSTRRTKSRSVDKSLLEIPEEEIDLQSLSLKDLIRLGEHREKLEIKEAKKLTTPLPNESANNDLHKEASHNEEETFPLEDDRNSDENQANYSVNASASFLNYQSYMDKAPTARWSKHDTELFYEAIQHCGSDFTMVQELYFPGRTRHQVKLKFKKEERQHPSLISDALLSRSAHSTDNSQFTSYIERIQQAAQAKNESNADESVDMTGKEEVELTHDTDEGVTKPESEKLQDQEADVEDQDVAAEVNNDEIDDDDFTWSE